MSTLNIQDLSYLAELDDHKVSVSGASGYSYGGHYDIEIHYSLDYDYRYYGHHGNRHYGHHGNRHYGHHGNRHHY